MDIVIVANYLGTLDGKSNNRFLYIADMLSKSNNVEIITGNFNHGEKKHFTRKIEEHDYAITLLHEPGYRKNVCFKRFWSDYIWGNNVKKYLKNRKKPDAFFVAVPPLTGALNIAKYCKKNKVKFIVDVQDLWPEAFKMVFNVPVISSIVFAPFNYIANRIYKQADEIIAVSQTYVNRVLAVNKKTRIGHSVFLGTSLEKFDENVWKNKIYKKNKNEIWLAYCGTLGASYDLAIVFDAMRKIEDERLRFIIMGDGPRKVEFERLAIGLNVDFLGNLPYDEMCGWLSACDININPIMKGAAQSIINKHADYAASGLPVISTQENIEYCELVNEYNMGFNCKNGDVNDFIKKLKELIDNENVRKEMGKGARRCAEEKFDRKKTYALIESTILGD